MEAEDTPAEMNCFLCHTAEPNQTARLAELEAGRFEWAGPAPLAGLGVVRRLDRQNEMFLEGYRQKLLTRLSVAPSS